MPTYVHLLIIAATGWLFGCSSKPVSEPVRPNIVIINIDDMGWKDVAYMGSSFYETPHIDSLSTAGVVFTNGYSAAANCAPARASLMTGQWTPRHGIFTVGTSERGASQNRKLIPVENTTTLAEVEDILPQLLKQNGYQTCHAGKWHLSDNPLLYGFDVNIGGGHNGHPKSYYPPYKNVNVQGDTTDYLTNLIMEKALEFVDTVSSPFLLYYAPYAVHTPIHPVQNLLEKYEHKSASDGPHNAAYATMIENLDRNIGLLINLLQQKKLFEHTLIVFTSDNGGLYGITRQKPLRAGKGSYYEGGIRVPFFICFPGSIRSNVSSSVPITHLDILPTVLHYAGIDKAHLELDGHNLSAILEGGSQALNRPLFWHFPIYLEAYNQQDNENRDALFRTRPGTVVRFGDWKLHYYFEDNEVELYNLTADIGERNNLAEEAKDKTDELYHYLQDWWRETKAPIPTNLNPDYVE